MNTNHLNTINLQKPETNGDIVDADLPELASLSNRFSYFENFDEKDQTRKKSKGDVADEGGEREMVSSIGPEIRNVVIEGVACRRHLARKSRAQIFAVWFQTDLQPVKQTLCLTPDQNMVLPKKVANDQLGIIKKC